MSATATQPRSKTEARGANGFSPALALAALGVVFGDTGTSPLYTLKTCFHFGRVPTATAWFALVFPTLSLNYLGQGALLLTNSAAFESPFFALTSGPLLLPMVILATVATVIASQALIFRGDHAHGASH